MPSLPLPIPIPLPIRPLDARHRDLFPVDLKVIGNLLVLGETGSGKTTFANHLIEVVATLSSPSEAQWLIVNPKILMEHHACPSEYLRGYLTELDEIMATLRDLMEHELPMRIRDHGDSHDNSDDDARHPRLLILVDEVASLVMSYEDEVIRILSHLAQVGPEYGIHLILMTSRLSIASTHPTILSIFPARLLLKVGTNSYVAQIMPGAHSISDSPGADLCSAWPKHGGLFRAVDVGISIPKWIEVYDGV